MSMDALSSYNKQLLAVLIDEIQNALHSKPESQSKHRTRAPLI